jgi:hypothetical protein
LVGIKKIFENEDELVEGTDDTGVDTRLDIPIILQVHLMSFVKFFDYVIMGVLRVRVEEVEEMRTEN